MSYRDFDYDYFYVVEKNDTLSQIVKKTFSLTSPTAVENKLQQVVGLNPHIKDVNKIYPGMSIQLGVNANACFAQPPNATAMDELSRTYNSFSPEVRRLVQGESELLNYFGYLLKYADHSLEQGSQFLEVAQKSLRPGTIKMTVTEIRRLYIQSMIETFGEVRGDRLIVGQRFQLRMWEQRLIRITIDDSGLRAYSRQLSEMGRIAKILKWGGRIVKVADAAIDLKEIYDAPNITTRDRTAHKVAVKTVMGGAAGGVGTYLICTLGFGLQSGGTSMIWCGALAGGSSAIIGSKGGEVLADKMYEKKWGTTFIHNLVEMFGIPEAR